MNYESAYGGVDEYNSENLYFYDDEAEGAVSFPTADRNDTIRISLDDLPDVQDLMNLLIAEKVTLSYWVRLAIFYYKKQRYDEFVELLQKSTTENRSGFEKDRVRALDMLAAYYVQRGNNERSKDSRREWFDKAKLLYTMADHVSRYDQNHLIGRAHFCLLEEKKEQEADIQLDFVLKQLSPTSADERLLIPACMGKACILYMRKDYKQSLEHFKKCLQASPNCPAFIRLGIGYCLVKLGKTEKAKIAFERCIELDPDNIDAQAALAVLQMTSPQNDEEMRSGIYTLGNLYKKEKDHPLILNHLANHFFIKSEIDENADKISLLTKSKKLLDHAIQITKNDQNLAESNFHLARYYHAQNMIVDAHRHYYQACQLSHPNHHKFVLPDYGYGQTSIYMKDIEKAIDSFEKVLKVQPNNVDTLKVLGALYARSSTSESTEKKLAMERKEKARSYLKKAAEGNPDDLDISMDLAVLLQRTEFPAALEVYNKVVEHLQKNSYEVPAEIYNNIGVLHYRMNEFEKARKAFLSCREALIANDVIDDKIKAELIVVSFNLARTDEKLDKFGEAERIYNGILKRRPGYCDARLRLACMAYNSGDTKAAIAHCEQLVEIDPNNIDAWLLHGNILYDENKLGPAQKKYEHVLKNIKPGNNDPLALVAMGNIWLKTLFDERRDRQKDPVHRERALNYYLKALKTNPQNVYAAHGAGCILAQKGEVNSACDVFAQVRENVASDYPDVWLNLASIQLDMSHYNRAANLYITYLHRFNTGQRFEIYCNTAFAFFKHNKLQEALDFLDRAMLEDPTNLILRYNHSLVLMRLSSNRITKEGSRLDDVQEAIKSIETAHEALDAISKLAVDKVQPYHYLSRTQCGELARQCKDILRQSEEFLARAEKVQIDEIRNLEALEMDRLRVLAKHRTEALRRAEEEEIRLEELKLKRRFFMQYNKQALKAVEIKDEPKQRSSGGGGGGGKKRKRNDRRMDDSDGFVNDIVDDEDTRAKRKKNKELARKKDREFIDDSDDERYPKLAKRKPRQEEDNPTRFKGKVKSRAIVEDSSSSSSDSDAGAKKPAKGSSDESDTSPVKEPRLTNNFSDSDADSDVGTSNRPTKSKSKKKFRKASSSSENGSEKAAANSDDGDSDVGAKKKTPTKKKAIVSSDESDNNNNSDGGAPAQQSDSDNDAPAQKKKNPFDSDSDSD